MFIEEGRGGICNLREIVYIYICRSSECQQHLGRYGYGLRAMAFRSETKDWMSIVGVTRLDLKSRLAEMSMRLKKMVVHVVREAGTHVEIYIYVHEGK